jgi:beta-lactamase superfamily II metal-dependent hydrolase
MEIRIFDVEHGFCAYVIGDNHNVMLIDCGHNEKTGFRPSDYLPRNRCSGVENFIVSNYDEDHISDLPNLCELKQPNGHNFIQTLVRNKSISGEELRKIKLKGGPIAPGMGSLLDMIKTYTHDVSIPSMGQDTQTRFFQNNYPDFEDTNNLSLVTFLHDHDIHLIFPGDLEKSGWLALLERKEFQEELAKTNLFVASHHGRISGYCEEVFNYCNPQLIIISDESKQYDTQDVDYSKHASGVKFGEDNRYVLTTRNDGMITISQKPGEGPKIGTQK